MATGIDVDGPWPEVRASVIDASRRFTGLLRSVSDPGRRAVGQWTIAETAAHVRAVCVLDSVFAAGMTPPADLRALVDKAATVTLAGVEEMNALSLQYGTMRDPVVIADKIEAQVDELVRAMGMGDGKRKVRWLGGLTASAAGVVSHLVSELLVHGRDIAAAEGRAFLVPDEEARLFFETFLFEVMLSPQLEDFAGARGGGADLLSWELRLKGSRPAFFVADGGKLLVMDRARHPVDIRVRAAPSAMLLLMFNRLSPVRAALRGKVLVWGRRPWMARRLTALMSMP